MTAAKTASSPRRKGKRSTAVPDTTGKQLVIVESPAKARTVNKYLGDDYVVLASIGHVRDLPARNPKGVKQLVPGVDLEKGFKPTYTILPGKAETIRKLKRAARNAAEVWFATDRDREGEAIAWHLAEELGIDPREAKRVIFPAITQRDIADAFARPHPIDMERVNAQQARRILDRIVGYQVSPMLWKKVARGLSAGRVQSVAVRLVVEREREIRAFVPDEYWQVIGRFTPDLEVAPDLARTWREFQAAHRENGKGPARKAENAWLAERGGVRAELVEVGGAKFQVGIDGSVAEEGADAPTAEVERVFEQAQEVMRLVGITGVRSEVRVDENGRGPSRWVRSVTGDVDPATPYRVGSIDTKRTRSRPPAPFITSTLQQAASRRLRFGPRRTMRVAQQLYEGIELPGEGPVGLITYMRTDSTTLSAPALEMAREHIGARYGDAYLPEKPRAYSSSNRDAQEAHEAIRPTNLSRPPERIRSALSDEQFRLYQMIWNRFVACQMNPAEWDATSVLITGGVDPATPCTFKATGRVLVFDGFYRVAGVPTAGDDQTLPSLEKGRDVAPFSLAPRQRFTSPPPRYSEASLIKTLEAEGIGRPSTYAAIVQVIQDREYVEQVDRRFRATDLGEVVTDMLMAAFEKLMDVGYTRKLENELEKIEDEHIDWVSVLQNFYGPFRESLDHALENLEHARAKTEPAPEEYRCEKCDSSLVYRFGRRGRFLSCSRYPECDYASPVDRDGRPMAAEYVDVRCPKTGRPMIRLRGRFGPFLATELRDDEPQETGMILNIDRKGFVVPPSPPPLETDLPCPVCGSPLNLRSGLRGPWLGCSRFPKCRGRGKWTEVAPEVRGTLERELESHLAANPVPVLERLDGTRLTDDRGRPLPDAPKVDALVLAGPPDESVRPRGKSAGLVGAR